jgi:hypothetical protein
VLGKQTHFSFFSIHTGKKYTINFFLLGRQPFFPHVLAFEAVPPEALIIRLLVSWPKHVFEKTKGVGRQVDWNAETQGKETIRNERQ